MSSTRTEAGLSAHRGTPEHVQPGDAAFVPAS